MIQLIPVGVAKTEFLDLCRNNLNKNTEPPQVFRTQTAYFGKNKGTVIPEYVIKTVSFFGHEFSGL